MRFVIEKIDRAMRNLERAKNNLEKGDLRLAVADLRHASENSEEGTWLLLAELEVSESGK